MLIIPKRKFRIQSLKLLFIETKRDFKALYLERKISVEVELNAFVHLAQLENDINTRLLSRGSVINLQIGLEYWSCTHIILLDKANKSQVWFTIG